MTGFGRAVVDCPDFSLTVDISSVNKKGLELSVALPRDWQSMERLVAQKIKKTFARGKVNVGCRVDFKKSASSFSIDDSAMSLALEKLRATCAKLGVEFKPSTDLILKLNDEISTCAETSADWEESWDSVDKTISQALEKIEQMRVAEGQSLKTDLSQRLTLIEGMLATVEQTSRGTVARYKELLLQRLANSGLELDLNDERVLKEISLFADKCDICEEITRLKSHIGQFRTTMEESEAAGRKMDFICQEMGREINTIASKANNLDLTKLAIEMKNELERIREQTQNVE